MSFIEIGADVEPFIDWLKRTENAFVHMTQTMKNVARVIREETLPLTPFETGKLGRSFRWHIVTDNSRMKVLQLQMTALNENTGYDYAWIQHENTSYNHFKPLGVSDQRTTNKIYHSHGFIPDFGHKGQSHYLREGIRRSEEGAFQIIEDDYLSLFTGDYVLW